MSGVSIAFISHGRLIEISKSCSYVMVSMRFLKARYVLAPILALGRLDRFTAYMGCRPVTMLLYSHDGLYQDTSASERRVVNLGEERAGRSSLDVCAFILPISRPP